MKRSEMEGKILSVIESFFHSNDPKYGFLAEYIMEEVDRDMLPPKRADESPTGYGAGYLSDEEVAGRYFDFKHSWEPEDEA